MLRTLYTVTAGTFTAIPALRFSRRVEIQEDGTSTGNGIAAKLPDDNFTAVMSYPPAQQPLILGNPTATGHGQGPLIGIPVQTGLNAKAASTYALVSAMSGTIIIRVTEFD
jgi:hypothetical protein